MMMAIDPISIANNAVDKGFQWWFLALLGIVLLGGVWSLKYLLAKSERDRASYDSHINQLVSELSVSRERHHERVEAMQNDALNMAREVTAMAAATAKVVESNTRESEKMRALVERIERKLEANGRV